jgi:nicotinamide-nucleotide amidase
MGPASVALHPTALQAEVIAVGSEMLFSGRIDSNSTYIGLQLERYGIGLAAKSVVADDVRIIRDNLALALSRAGLIFLTGGLGPTEDDLTRDAVSEQLGLELVYHPQIVEQIEKRFRRLGRTMSEINKRQGFILEGATPLANGYGTAPGQYLRFEGRHIFLLPGPPSELQPMIEEHLPPLLDRLGLHPRARRYFRIAGLPESQVDATVSPVYRQYPEIQSTILASPGDIELFFFSPEEGPRLEELASRVHEALGEAIFATEEITLETAVARLLRQRHATLAVAESCTGGMLGEWITRVEGSSSFFSGGVVAYSNRLKEELLGVPARLLRQHGAVSAAVAEAMAEGARHSAGVDFALSVTGVAGPGGGTEAKPVGTVFIGYSDSSRCRSSRHQFLGGREAVRVLSTRTALNLLRKELLALAPDGQDP